MYATNSVCMVARVGNISEPERKIRDGKSRDRHKSGQSSPPQYMYALWIAMEHISGARDKPEAARVTRYVRAAPNIYREVRSAHANLTM